MSLTASFITDADLQTYMPDVLQFGVASFTTQNLQASDDVFARLVDEWWPNAIGQYYGFTRERVDLLFPTLPAMNVAFLDIASLKQLTVYRALAHYVMPLLSSDADANGDLFTRRSDRYTRFVSEEWKKVIRLPLYDFNKDGLFTPIERPLNVGRRLVRA